MEMKGKILSSREIRSDPAGRERLVSRLPAEGTQKVIVWKIFLDIDEMYPEQMYFWTGMNT
jgi:hypothetical protein